MNAPDFIYLFLNNDSYECLQAQKNNRTHTKNEVCFTALKPVVGEGGKMLVMACI